MANPLPRACKSINDLNVGDTFRHYAKLTRIRKGYSALRRGDTTLRWSSTHVAAEEDAGIFAFERTGGDAGDAYALVVLNTNGRKPSDTANGNDVRFGGRESGRYQAKR